jgi:hypothetical protein
MDGVDPVALEKLKEERAKAAIDWFNFVCNQYPPPSSVDAVTLTFTYDDGAVLECVFQERLR